jgi:predicted regulator of Ras-like GTPase activity (Roadblock/LC7/MglB family)
VTVEETRPIKNLRANLEEIKTYDGVIGYILRNSTSAAIDLKDPTKIIDYAILSSSALDASEKLCELFHLGEVKNITVEGGEVKAVSLIVDENRISIFMEKDADCEKVLRKLHSL